MHRDAQTRVVCSGDCGVELSLSERGPRYSRIAEAIIGIEFDPVGAVRHLLTNSGDDIVDAARLLGALRKIEVRPPVRAAGTIGAPRDNGPGRHLHARAKR